MYIFRNYTIENLFDNGYIFSGYGDISNIPEADGYIWFYNVPFQGDINQIVEEVKGINDKLRFISTRIPKTVPFYIFTLEQLFPTETSCTNYSLQDAIDEVNRNIRKIGEENSNVRIIKFRDFLSLFPPIQWINWKFYFLSQIIISPSIAPAFKEWWKKQLKDLTNPRKKCLVLDLDNTLWDGVLGEDGASGVKMNGDYPGNAFMYFQEALVDLANSGVILTICSKNNEADVLSLWENNPFVKIGPKQIAAYRINWQNKADNIRELAKELNIGLDSMVFVDDNPTERELIKQQLPMIAVPEFPRRPYELMMFYQSLIRNYFRTYRLTQEDMAKTEQYKANAQRASIQTNFSDLTDFIRSLEINIEIIKADEFNIPRIAQMTQKTNQFNLTTKRYNEADIYAFIDKGDDVYCISVRDKFGDNGITGEIIISNYGEFAIIDTLLLSCRILGKDIEIAFVKSILNMLYDKGFKTIKATYIATSKNNQVSDFYDKIGFRRISETRDSHDYILHLNSKFDIPDYYNITIK